MQKRLFLACLVVLGAVSLALLPRAAMACTNVIVTKGASVDGSTTVTYAADSHSLYGELAITPARQHVPGSLRDIVEGDTGKFLGRIPEIPETYAVVGLINEYQVAMGETTFGGRKELKGPSGILDYVSLMALGLERGKTAREAIQVMGQLVAEHGYASEGESISVTDPQEAWLFEIIGKGEKEKGAVWVARRIPDGYICAHANKPRIHRFPLNDPLNCLYSKDVVAFARDKGWFKGKDEELDFADTYYPPNFGALRFCEARVWSMFRRVQKDAVKYVDWVKGKPGAEPMPLWIKPERKLTV
jgi:dipeptidase